MIVLIHGNAGVGKSTVAQMLGEHLDHSIVIEVDQFRYNVVDRRVESDQLDLCDTEVFSVAEAFLSADYSTVIVEGVYPSQKHLNKVVDYLHHIDSDVYVYRLECEFRENLRRDEKRADDLTVGDKVEEAFHSFEKLDHDKEIGYVVDSTHLTPDQTVEEIETLIERNVGKVD